MVKDVLRYQGLEGLKLLFSSFICVMISCAKRPLPTTSGPLQARHPNTMDEWDLQVACVAFMPCLKTKHVMSEDLVMYKSRDRQKIDIILYRWT